MVNRPVHAVNWFCSGYAKAITTAFRPTDPGLQLKQNQFLLVVTASRISRITDYSCKQTGALFGDMATVTMLSRTDNKLYPSRFRILFANVKRYPTATESTSDFHMRNNVLSAQQRWPIGNERSAAGVFVEWHGHRGIPLHTGDVERLPWPTPYKPRDSLPKTCDSSFPIRRGNWHCPLGGDENGNSGRARASDQRPDQ